MCLEISVLMTAIGGIFKPSSMGNCISLVRGSKVPCVISVDRDKEFSQLEARGQQVPSAGTSLSSVMADEAKRCNTLLPAFVKMLHVMGLCWHSVKVGFINIKLFQISCLPQRQTHPKINVSALKSANQPCQGREEQPNACSKHANVM